MYQSQTALSGRLLQRIIKVVVNFKTLNLVELGIN